VLEVWLVKGSKSSYNYCDIFIFETLSLTYDQTQEHESIIWNFEGEKTHFTGIGMDSMLGDSGSDALQ
jgi:hypothetical protein